VNEAYSVGLQPVLGRKNYTKKLGGPRQKTYDPFTKEILDEINHYSGDAANVIETNFASSRQPQTHVSTERAGPNNLAVTASSKKNVRAPSDNKLPETMMRLENPTTPGKYDAKPDPRKATPYMLSDSYS